MEQEKQDKQDKDKQEKQQNNDGIPYYRRFHKYNWQVLSTYMSKLDLATLRSKSSLLRRWIPDFSVWKRYEKWKGLYEALKIEDEKLCDYYHKIGARLDPHSLIKLKTRNIVKYGTFSEFKRWFPFVFPAAQEEKEIEQGYGPLSMMNPYHTSIILPEWKNKKDNKKENSIEDPFLRHELGSWNKYLKYNRFDVTLPNINNLKRRYCNYYVYKFQRKSFYPFVHVSIEFLPCALIGAIRGRDQSEFERIYSLMRTDHNITGLLGPVNQVNSSFDLPTMIGEISYYLPEYYSKNFENNPISKQAFYSRMNLKEDSAMHDRVFEHYLKLISRIWMHSVCTALRKGEVEMAKKGIAALEEMRGSTLIDESMIYYAAKSGSYPTIEYVRNRTKGDIRKTLGYNGANEKGYRDVKEFFSSLSLPSL